MNKVWSVKMEHFIGSLGFVDNTKQIHWVPRRLFVVSDDLYYPEHSHPVLDGNFKKENFEEEGFCSDVIIYHLGHLPIEYLDYILYRYKQHSKDSIIHNQQFLKQWKLSHLFGQYPKREINPLELPKEILNRYELDSDEFYHSRYQLELKHPEMVKQWYDFFKPDSVLDLGCSRGCYLKYWKWFKTKSGGQIKCRGIEKSEWAVLHPFTKDIVIGNITDKKFYHINNSHIEHSQFKYDLITAIDVLEHLDDIELDITLKNMSEGGGNFLFSLPFEGDPNLLADNTHKQFKTREEWIKLIESYGIKIKEPPQDWLFANQILIGEKNAKKRT